MQQNAQEKEKIFFEIDGATVPKQSARFCKKGAFIRSYQPKKILNYAEKAQEAFKKKYPTHNIVKYTNVPIAVQIKIFFKIPKSKSKAFKMGALEGKIRPLCKPDTDNLSKGIKDAMNGVLWADDKQVVQETIEKWYAERPRAEVSAWQI